MLLHINLWEPSSTYPGPHGVVHRGCKDARCPREPDKWHEADVEDPEDVDPMFPGCRLYWCSRRACFGPNNPRRIPRNRNR